MMFVVFILSNCLSVSLSSYLLLPRALSRVRQGIVALMMILVSPLGLAVELPTPNKFGTDFTLDSTLVKELSLSALKQKVVLLNFGYTSCPDICPMVLSRLARISKDLGDPEGLQVLFVSFDSKRDTISHLKKYLGFFHPRFVGLNGDDEEIRQVFKSFGGLFEKEDGGLFSHSDYIYVINTDGEVTGFYRSQDAYEAVLTAVRKHF